MEYKNYTSTLDLQVRSLNDLAIHQVGVCFDPQKVTSIMSKEELSKIERIIFTGCGDSYSAGGVIASAFRNEFKGLELIAADPMEFTRYMRTSDIVKGNNSEKTLVVVVSASGGTARISEMLLKAKAIGVSGMLLTNNEKSKGALNADYVYGLETPPLSNTPGLRSYYASLIGLISIVYAIAIERGLSTTNNFKKLEERIIRNQKNVDDELNHLSEQLFEFSKSILKINKVEVVGDMAALFSAQFGEEKVIEGCGIPSLHTNSEDWAHINTWTQTPSDTLSVFLVNSKEPNYDIMKENIKVAEKLGNSILVVTDRDLGFKVKNGYVAVLPYHQKKDDVDIMALVDFIPLSLLVEFYALQNGISYFNAFDMVEHKFDEERMKVVFKHGSTGGSEIKIFK